MATIISLSKERILEIEAASIVDGEIVGDNLHLTTHDGTVINAGNVRGPVGAGGLPNLYTDQAITDYVSCSPIEISLPYNTGQFTPDTSSVIVTVDLKVTVEEGGGGRAGCRLLYSQTVAHPLCARGTDPGGGPTTKAGVVGIDIGATNGTPGSVPWNGKLTGLTPGVPVNYEITAAVVGNAQIIPMPDTLAPISVAASKNIGFITLIGGYSPIIGDSLLAFCSTTNLYLAVSNHSGNPYDKIIGSVALPGSAQPREIDITPDGKYIVCVNQTDQTFSVYRTDTMALLYATQISLQGTGITKVTCGPESQYAYISCSYLGQVAGISILTGAVTAAYDTGAGVGAGDMEVRVELDNTAIYVGAKSNGNIYIFNPVTHALVATRNVGTSFACMNFDETGLYMYAVGKTGSVLKLFRIDIVGSATVDAGVAIINTIVPTRLEVMSDGKTLVISSDEGVGRDLILYNIPDRSAAAYFPNLGGVQGVKDFALTTGGSIVMLNKLAVTSPVAAAGNIAIYYGGKIHMRASLTGFYGELSRISVLGAV